MDIFGDLRDDFIGEELIELLQGYRRGEVPKEACRECPFMRWAADTLLDPRAEDPDWLMKELETMSRVEWRRPCANKGED